MKSYIINNGGWDDFLCADEPDFCDYDVLFGGPRNKPPIFQSANPCLSA